MCDKDTEKSDVSECIDPVLSPETQNTLLSLVSRETAISELDLEFCYISLNARFTELTRYSIDDLVGEKFTSTLSGDYPASDWNAISRRLESGQTWTGEVCHTSQAGEIYLKTTISPVSDSQGTISHYLATQQEQSVNAKEPPEETAELKTLSEACKLANIGYWEFRPHAIDSVVWSDAIKRIHEVDLSFKPDVESGIKFYKEGKHRETVRQAVEKAISEGHSFQFETILVTAKGNEKWVRSIAETEMQNGQCVRILGILQDIDQEKRERIQHAETSALLRDVIDAATEYSFVSTDTVGVIQVFNAASERMYGYSKEEVIGKATPVILHDEATLMERAAELSDIYGEPIPHAEVYIKVPREKGIEIQETTGRRKDGSLFPISLTVTPTHSSSGEIIGYLGIAQDLTQLKEIQQSLSAVEQRFQSAFHGSSIGMLIQSISGETIDVNSAICQILGYDRDTLIKNGFTGIVPEEEVEKGHQIRAESIANEKDTYKRDKQYIHAKGHLIWTRLTSTLIRGKNTEPLYYFYQIEDISKSKQLEEELHRMSDRLKIAADASELGIWDWNMSDGSYFWDDKMYKLFEIDKREEVPNIDTFWERVHPEDLEVVRGKLQGAVERTAPFEVDFRILLRNRRVRYIRAMGKIIRDSEDRPVRMVGTNLDITEQVKQQKRLASLAEEAEAANQSKSDFLANMSHEIRTPLNGILGMASMLHEMSNTTPEQDEYIKVIQNSGSALLSLITDILDFAKIEAGKIEIEQTDFSLRNLLEECKAISGVKAIEKKLTFKCHASPNTPDLLIGDPTRIRQVLLNLCSNAVKFTNSGSVRVFVEPIEQTDQEVSLKFSVIDTGIGIDLEHTRKLFQQFTQADSSTSRQYGGSGLGLAISKELVELMGGTIAVRSDLGVGSVFSFVIKLAIYRTKAPAIESEAHLATAKEAVDTTNNQNKRILIVEDNKANQLVIRGLLKKFDFRIQVVSNGQEAIEAVQAQTFDLVLMDVQMPVMDGIEAAQRIRDGRANALNPEIPIIAITAHARKEDRDSCINSGMNDYVTKPVNRETLFTAIKKQLKDIAP